MKTLLYRNELRMIIFWFVWPNPIYFLDTCHFLRIVYMLELYQCVCFPFLFPLLPVYITSSKLNIYLISQILTLYYAIS